MKKQVMLGYTRTHALIYYYFAHLDLRQRGLVELIGDRFFATREEIPEDVTDLAYMFNLPVSEVEAAWDRRAKAAWEGFRAYLISQIEDREEYLAEQSVAGLASAEARKSAITEDLAKEILGDNFKVYEAFVTYWHHKKITDSDCHKINNLVSAGKVTAEKLAAKVKDVAEATTADRFQYMKSIGSWLDSGSYQASVKRPKPIPNVPERLQAAEAAGAQEYLSKRGMA